MSRPNKKSYPRPLEPHEKHYPIEAVLLNRSRHLEGKKGHYDGRPITSRIIDLDINP